jgi:DNA-binding MarR family transcriptional regulator
MTEGPTAYGEVERELAVLLRRARAWNRDVATEVHPDLQPAAYALLARVDEVGSVRASDLGAYFGIDKGAISRQVQHLCDLGLLEREPDPVDGRAVLISASPDAVLRMQALDRDRRKWLEGQLAEWSEGDLRAFVSGLARYNTALDQNP